MSGAVSTSDPVAHATLLDAKDDMITLGVHGTDYRVQLVVSAKPSTPVGEHVSGTIHAKARRVDAVTTGGRFIDPVYGRPRRLQGRVISLDPVKNVISVFCGLPFHCTMMPEQKTSQFELGQMVSFDVERGARFEPEHH